MTNRKPAQPSPPEQAGDQRSSRVTVPEICRDLGLGRLRVYEMLEAKIIPNVRIGRTWLVTRNAYERWKGTCGLNELDRRKTLAS